MIHSREDLALAQRVVIKAGTSVVSTPDGFPSLSRIANIVENTANLVRQGKEVLIVTSGAVGIGRQKLKKQALLKQSMSDILFSKHDAQPHANGGGKVSYNSACAAAGQLGLMALYETMFNQYDIATSQLLVTAFDFTSPERRRNVQFVISQLLSLGIVPLINENDAVSANQGYQLFGNSFADNDSLASLVAIELSAQLLLLLTDVKGVYDRPPTDPGSQLIDVFDRGTGFKVGDKSLQGRGGMGAKVDAALKAIDGGVQAVIIAAGGDYGIIDKIMDGSACAGTAFFAEDNKNLRIRSSSHSSNSDNSSTDLGENNNDSSSHKEGDDSTGIRANNNTTNTTTTTTTTTTTHHTHEQDIEILASHTRIGQRQLNQCDEMTRQQILYEIAQSLQVREKDILDANAIDLEIAKESGLDTQAYNRLKLTSEKLAVLSQGITAIANSAPCIGKLLSLTEVSPGLQLEKRSCSLGVLLIIFESRPDCLPQIASLAIKSGNGLILKGGKEAERSNHILHSIIIECIERVTNGSVDRGVISLVSRAEIPTLLKLDHVIDLVIPRGSSDLVKYIKENTKIPVMGHAEGICHIYIDEDAEYYKAERIVIDAKTDYPSACNAVECTLIHEKLIENGFADKLIRALRTSGISIYVGPRAMALGLAEKESNDFHTEYGDLSMTIEVINDVTAAIHHIHTYGSGHTESIVTENSNTAKIFCNSIDSACVFHNASTRFADGFRFGLGAEVGISTGRIHARGPVGVDGLLTYKWILSSDDSHIVGDFSTIKGGIKKYTHKILNIE